MASVLSFDFGLGHIGVAVGNEQLETASPLKALRAKDGIPDQAALDMLMRQWQPKVAVVGLPLNMDGSEQEMTHRARRFGNRLHEKYGVIPVFVDERLTSAQVKEEIFQQGGFKALASDKGRIDSAAACAILEQYWNSLELRQ